MSHSALYWAGSQSPATSPQKLLLFQLAWHVNSESGLCNPSLATLAAETGLGLSTIKRALAGLQEQGLIVWESSAKQGKRFSNRYRLNLTIRPTAGHSPPSIGSQRAINRPTTGHVIGPQRATNQEEESIKESTSVREIEGVDPERVARAKEQMRKIRDSLGTTPLAATLRRVLPSG